MYIIHPTAALMFKLEQFISYWSSTSAPAPVEYPAVEVGEDIPTLLEKITTTIQSQLKNFILTRKGKPIITIPLIDNSLPIGRLQTLSRKNRLHIQRREIKKRDILYRDFLAKIAEILNFNEPQKETLEIKFREANSYHPENKKNPKLKNLGLRIKI